MANRLEIAQNELEKKNLYNGPIDGLYNNETIKTLDGLPVLYPAIRPEWPPQRKTYGFLQIVCLESGFNPGDIDGRWGPNTDNAYNNFLYFLVNNKPPESWRPEEIVQVNPNNWPVQYTPEFDTYYGPKGLNLIRTQLPYPMRLSWETGTTLKAISCHMKVSDSVQRVLAKVLDHYGLPEIQRLRLDLFGGCYNERPIRGGTRWSMHSWGIAIDIDPDHNRLDWGRDKAAFASSEYNKWFEFWEEEGWISLGRQRNFDWMHVQAAKI